ncbi:MAG: DUF5320 domain-containing protein [Nanoarchaeota archaeon]|nr:DUF5320 domain-containing protein [Nanoarchaeota archaeon]
MPNKDQTGPEGKGPKTGRQMGNCNDAEPVGQNPRLRRRPQEKGLRRMQNA